MQVDFRMAHNDISGALAHHVQRRLRFALSRVTPNVSHVSVRVSGTVGRDVQCELTADLKPFGQAAVQATAPDLMSAIDAAIGKLKRFLERQQHRAQDHRLAARLAA